LAPKRRPKFPVALYIGIRTLWEDALRTKTVEEGRE